MNKRFVGDDETNNIFNSYKNIEEMAIFGSFFIDKIYNISSKAYLYTGIIFIDKILHIQILRKISSLPYNLMPESS